MLRTYLSPINWGMSSRYWECVYIVCRPSAFKTMLRLFRGLFLLLLVEATPVAKIFGGHTEPVGEHSFLVNLRRGGTFRCGAALISPTCALTAAHCLEGRPDHVRDLTVHAIQQCLNEESPPEHVRRAWYVGVSPHYSPRRGLDSDVAVIRLTRPFDISGNASFLHIDYNDLPRQANLTIMGWGMVREDFHNRSQCLQVAQVEKTSQAMCIQKMGSADQPVTGNMFCALGANATDACPGDSGGPVIYNGRTAGIVSWGYGCGSGYPGVYTRLSSPPISYWIKSFVDRHCWR